MDWSSLRPILDEVLDELAQEDRDALLLRFFEEQSLSQVGAALGLAEDTARKRISRALEKLRQALSYRGVTTTGMALSFVLTTRGAETVPPGLVAQFASGALAAAKTGTATSAAGILGLMTSTKVTAFVAASAVLLLLSAAVVKLSVYKGNEAATSPATETGGLADTQAAQFVPAHRVSEARSDVSGRRERALAAALERLQAVLDDPRPMTSFPNPAMQEALAALGEDRQAALPLLREALKTADARVSDRAADGLAQIGPEAREAMPDLVQKLRTATDDGGAGMLVWALETIAPSPDEVPDLVQILKNNPATRLAIANSLATSQWGDAANIAQNLRPLLQDPDPGARESAAYSLAMLLRNQSGEDVSKVVIEGLKSTDEDTRSLALSALKNIASDPNDPSGRVTPARLGAGFAEAASALADLANNSNRKDHQMLALQLLEAIQPGLRAENPTMDGLLRDHEQDAAFATQVRAGEVPLADLIGGIQKHPGAIGLIANALASMEADARPALPALQQALAGLELPKSAASADIAQATRSRTTIVEAIQRIAPDQPKPLFTEPDVRSIMVAFSDPSVTSDPNRKQRIASALLPVFADVDGRPAELSPDQMRRLLAALKTADQPLYDAIAARVSKIDPHFLSQPKR